MNEKNKKRVMVVIVIVCALIGGFFLTDCVKFEADEVQLRRRFKLTPPWPAVPDAALEFQRLPSL